MDLLPPRTDVLSLLPIISLEWKSVLFSYSTTRTHPVWSSLIHFQQIEDCWYISWTKQCILADYFEKIEMQKCTLFKLCAFLLVQMLLLLDCWCGDALIWNLKDGQHWADICYYHNSGLSQTFWMSVSVWCLMFKSWELVKNRRIGYIWAWKL